MTTAAQAMDQLNQQAASVKPYDVKGSKVSIADRCTAKEMFIEQFLGWIEAFNIQPVCAQRNTENRAFANGGKNSRHHDKTALSHPDIVVTCRDGIFSIADGNTRIARWKAGNCEHPDIIWVHIKVVATIEEELAVYCSYDSVNQTKTSGDDLEGAYRLADLKLKSFFMRKSRAVVFQTLAGVKAAQKRNDQQAYIRSLANAITKYRDGITRLDDLNFQNDTQVTGNFVYASICLLNEVPAVELKQARAFVREIYAYANRKVYDDTDEWIRKYYDGLVEAQEVWEIFENKELQGTGDRKLYPAAAEKMKEAYLIYLQSA